MVNGVKGVSNNIYSKIIASLKEHYIIRGGPVHPQEIVHDDRFRFFNHNTIERAIRAMGEKEIITRVSTGRYKPKDMKMRFENEEGVCPKCGNTSLKLSNDKRYWLCDICGRTTTRKRNDTSDEENVLMDFLH